MYVALEDDDITYDFVRGLGSYDTLLETQKNTDSSLTLAKMLRAEKSKQQAKMHKKKLSTIIK